MPEASKPEPQSSASSSRALAPAGESTDPAVHQLLAEREIARLNLAARQSDKDAADEQSGSEQEIFDAKTAELKKLGYK